MKDGREATRANWSASMRSSCWRRFPLKCLVVLELSGPDCRRVFTSTLRVSALCVLEALLSSRDSMREPKSKLAFLEKAMAESLASLSAAFVTDVIVVAMASFFFSSDKIAVEERN